MAKIFDITHYFSSDEGFTNIVVQSTGQSGAEMKAGVTTCVRTMVDIWKNKFKILQS